MEVVKTMGERTVIRPGVRVIDIQELDKRHEGEVVWVGANHLMFRNDDGEEERLALEHAAVVAELPAGNAEPTQASMFDDELQSALKHPEVREYLEEAWRSRGLIPLSAILLAIFDCWTTESGECGKPTAIFNRLGTSYVDEFDAGDDRAGYVTVEMSRG